MKAKLTEVDTSTKHKPLPEQDYVSLAEAVTWAVEGDCRNDQALAAEETCELNRIEADTEESLSGIDARTSRQRRYERCYDLLRELCSNDSVTLVGRPDFNVSGVASSNAVHEAVAPSFFSSSLFCWWDLDRRGITKAPRQWASSDWMTRYPFAFRTPSFEYRDVRITRGHALKLQRKFMMISNPRLLTSDLGGGRPGAPRNKRESVKAVLRLIFPEGVPPEMKNAAVAAAVQQELTAQGKPTVSPRTIDKAREEFAQE